MGHSQESSTMNKDKRKTSRSNSLRGGRQRAVERSSFAEGIYTNCNFMHAVVNSHVGNVVRVEMMNGTAYEGIFRTFSSQFEVVLQLAHKVDPLNSTRVDINQVRDTMIIRMQDVVLVSAKNVDCDYASKDMFQTDTSISKFNGDVTGVKELEPWVGDTLCNGEEYDLSCMQRTQNGWDVHEMFRTNENDYGVQSTYDDNLTGYTCEINRENTSDYRADEEKAAKIAQEIERSASSLARSALENGDNEEELFAAVVRPSAENAKYVPPAKRKSHQPQNQRNSDIHKQHQQQPSSVINNSGQTQSKSPRINTSGNTSPAMLATNSSPQGKQHARPGNINIRPPPRNQKVYNVPESPPAVARQGTSMGVQRYQQPISSADNRGNIPHAYQGHQQRPTSAVHRQKSPPIPVPLHEFQQQSRSQQPQQRKPMSGTHMRAREDQINDLKKFRSDFNLSVEAESGKQQQSPGQPQQSSNTISSNSSHGNSLEEQTTITRPAPYPQDNSHYPQTLKLRQHVVSQFPPPMQQFHHQPPELITSNQSSQQTITHFQQQPQVSSQQQQQQFHTQQSISQVSLPQMQRTLMTPTQQPLAVQYRQSSPNTQYQQNSTRSDGQSNIVGSVVGIYQTQEMQQYQQRRSPVSPNKHQLETTMYPPTQTEQHSYSANSSEIVSSQQLQVQDVTSNKKEDDTSDNGRNSIQKTEDGDESDVEKVSATLKKSTLNPNAKEFIYNPNAKPFTPRSPSTPSQSRPATPIYNSMHSATGIQMVMPTYVVAQPAYVATAPPTHPTRMRKVTVGTHRAEYHPSNMQVAAATGQPLLAPTVTLSQASPFAAAVQGYAPHAHLAAAAAAQPTYHQVQMVRMVTQQGGTMVPLVPTTVNYHHDSCNGNQSQPATAMYVNHAAPPSTAPSPSQTPHTQPTQAATPYPSLMCPVIQAAPGHGPPHHIMTQSQYMHTQSISQQGHHIQLLLPPSNVNSTN